MAHLRVVASGVVGFRVVVMVDKTKGGGVFESDIITCLVTENCQSIYSLKNQSIFQKTINKNIPWHIPHVFLQLNVDQSKYLLQVLLSRAR